MEDNQKLKDLVLSEVDLLELLNIEKRTLDTLRLEKGLPFIRLSSKCRVYLAEQVLDWLKQYNKSIQ